MSHISIQYYKSPYAEFIIGDYQQQLCLMDFRYRKMREQIDLSIQRSLHAPFVEQNTLLIQQTREQLEQYFWGKRSEFDLPLLMVGSDVEKQVWLALRGIGYGLVSSYQRLAQLVEPTLSIRDVARANGANALAIIVPCHRILSDRGELLAYGGGIALKKRLLDLEQNLFL